MDKRKIAVFLTVLLISIWVIQIKPVNAYVMTLTSGNQNKDMENDPLYREIQKRAKEIDADPIEPKIDRVWKLIPGYNGIKVNLPESIKRSKAIGGRINLVTEEIPPKKSVWDLPPNPIYRGNPNKPSVALMINVAWGNEYLEKMLATLAEKGTKATFFLDGSWLRKNPELAKQIVQGGHEIGSHGFSHPLMSRLSRERIIEEIEKTNTAIEQILKIQPTLFAPPAGDFDQRVVQIAWERKMLTILWTLDTVDWKKPKWDVMVKRILDQVDQGHLILMHPTDPTAKGLGAMIDGIKQKGLNLGTVSEVLSPERHGNIEIIGNL
jgi:probable sporulation protein (polysaccharide deacetylase family)